MDLMQRHLQRVATHSSADQDIVPPSVTPTRALAKKFQDTESQQSMLSSLGVKTSKRLPASPANDVWSLGATAFELMTGQALIPSNCNDDATVQLSTLYRQQMQVLPELINRRELYFQFVPDEVVEALQYDMEAIVDRAIDLVSRCLTHDPATRLRINEMRAHPFLHLQASSIINLPPVELAQANPNPQHWETQDTNARKVVDVTSNLREHFQRMVSLPTDMLPPTLVCARDERTWPGFVSGGRVHARAGAHARHRTRHAIQVQLSL